jgi:tetratricopeptide (TPR) repeat protein
MHVVTASDEGRETAAAKDERDVPPVDRKLQAALADLEARAAEASTEYKAQHYSRAADLCAAANDRERALHYWGQAIDLYLTTARPRAAAALCRKVIRFAPDTIRARRTLALLSLGEGEMQQAAEDLEEYVEAARRTHHEQLARKQIRLMSEATSAPEFRVRAADLLQRLGDDAGAVQLRESATARSDALALSQDAMDSPGLLDEASDRWSTILRLALMPPEQIDRL